VFEEFADLHSFQGQTEE